LFPIVLKEKDLGSKLLLKDAMMSKEIENSFDPIIAMMLNALSYELE